ncbi:F0F1 ATP synthase subunit delta [uncultured Clostridium sp.]|uniref:F0F1 ATP synthase subunit delta n=1 Tax=uncultured Clostridium sp. TaxID=59620 RepID=UPI00260DB005|nr:F0F1 ATP synthase subunit delta [uncultured Clostridium sp.]
MYDFLDIRYAKALYDIGKKKGKVEEFLVDLTQICDIFDENKKLMNLMIHPEIKINKKKEVFTKLFGEKIDDELLTFMYIVIEKGRIGFLREKVNQLESIYLEEINTLKGVVKTAVPLTGEQYEGILKCLEKKYEKTIILVQEIDKDLIGGVYIKINNQIIDGTIKGKYEELKKKILS